MKVQRETFIVYQSHLQPNGVLSVPAMAGFMQEAAWANVKDIGVSTEELFKNDMAWVLTKMHWEFVDTVQHREKVTIETWPSGSDKYFFYRDFRLYKGKKLFAKVTTTWILINLQSRQLMAVPENLSKLSFSHYEAPMPRANNKIVLPKEYGFTKEYTVNWHHLDVNKHANNTFYLQWLLDALSYDFLSKKSIKSLDVIFKTESTMGDVLTVKTITSEGGASTQAIFNQKGKELVRAHTQWI